LPLQAKLLRAIQEQRIKPVGGNDEIPVDVRLVGATHQDLDRMVRANRFREDLYYRLNVVMIGLPPLRERREDIPILIEHFLNKSAHESGQTAPRFSAEAEQALRSYSWPGNVRELANVVERAVVLSSHGVITPDALPARVLGEANAPRPPAPPSTPTSFVTLEESIDRYVRAVLEHTGGNHSQAARILGISRRTLHRMEARWRSGSGGPPEWDEKSQAG
jgi:two-component system response regulator HydG